MSYNGFEKQAMLYFPKHVKNSITLKRDYAAASTW